MRGCVTGWWWGGGSHYILASIRLRGAVYIPSLVFSPSNSLRLHSSDNATSSVVHWANISYSKQCTILSPLFEANLPIADAAPVGCVSSCNGNYFQKCLCKEGRRHSKNKSSIQNWKKMEQKNLRKKKSLFIHSLPLPCPWTGSQGALELIPADKRKKKKPGNFWEQWEYSPCQ